MVAAGDGQQLWEGITFGLSPLSYPFPHDASWSQSVQKKEEDEKGGREAEKAMGKKGDHLGKERQDFPEFPLTLALTWLDV